MTTFTENGAIAYATTGNPAVDFFISSVRNADAATLAKYLENVPILTTGKLLMQLRDPRKGKGEKKLSIELLLWLRKTHPEIYVKNLSTIVEYGCFKDILKLACLAEEQQLEKLNNDEYVELIYYANIVKQIFDDPNCKDNLLSLKWVPTEKKSLNNKYKFTDRFAKLIFGNVNNRHALLRKNLSSARSKLNVTETLMCANQWNKIVYSHVPSRAHMLYRKSFSKHDTDRYNEYLANVRHGNEKINSLCIHPHELCERAFTNYDETLQQQWNTMLEDLRKNTALGKALAVVDVSGSMNGLPMNVAVSFGLILSELVAPPFANKFITFSKDPELQTVSGNNLLEKLNSIKNSQWSMNTDFFKVFKLLLDHAKLFNIGNDAFPDTIFVFTDMQFDAADNNDAFDPNNSWTDLPNENYVDDSENQKKMTLFQSIKELYSESGFTVPKLIFWNLREGKPAFPVISTQADVVYLSGFSPILLKMVHEKNFDANIMLDSILEPYNFII